MAVEEILGRAIEERRLVAFDYQACRRTLEPHRLGYGRGGTLLLQSWVADVDRPSWRLFEVDRIRNPILLETRFDSLRPALVMEERRFLRILAEVTFASSAARRGGPP